MARYMQRPENALKRANGKLIEMIIYLKECSV